MKFSLLIPTRDRIHNILPLISNIKETVSNINNIEVLFICDSDDKLTFNALFKYRIYDNFYFLTIKRSDYLNRDYYNKLARYSSGNYLWAIADDVKFHTKNWDIILEEKIEDYLKDKKDRIAYISVKEKGSNAKHPCFPLITKEAFKALNMYFHPELMSWGADRCLHELYSAVDRTFRIEEVEIEHLSYHDGKALYDKTAQSMKERFFRDPDCHNKVVLYVLPQQIKILKGIIYNA